MYQIISKTWEVVTEQLQYKRFRSGELVPGCRFDLSIREEDGRASGTISPSPNPEQWEALLPILDSVAKELGLQIQWFVSVEICDRRPIFVTETASVPIKDYLADY